MLDDQVEFKKQLHALIHADVSLLRQVILGGGRVYMFPENTVDQEYPSIKGSRKDGRNLVSEWLNEKKVNLKFFLFTLWNKLI